MLKYAHVMLLVVLYQHLTVGDNGVPTGHLQPLGSNMPPLAVEELYSFPDPIEFFNSYVKPSKPVIFRGAAKQFPSYYNWKNDTHLKQNYGEWVVDIEKGKKENRKGDGLQIRFSKFLDLYKRKDIYLVKDILKPNPMTEEVYVPKSLLCDDFMRHISTVVMWFSSGGTKSVLHNDGSENINCLFDGTKKLYMVDKKYVGSVDNIEDRGYSSVDVDRVDLVKYPDMAHLPWYEATMETGDCLYIPIMWMHHVNSSTTRNLAINLWWAPLLDMPNRRQCEEKLPTLPEYDAWSNYDVDRENEARAILVSEFEPYAEPITSDVFSQVMYEQFSTSMDVLKQETDAMFAAIDADGDGEVSYVDMYRAPASVYHVFLDAVREKLPRYDSGWRSTPAEPAPGRYARQEL